MSEEKQKKAANPNLGQCQCPFCDTRQPVRKNNPKSGNGKFYIACGNCGLIQPALPFFQEWIMDHATLYGAEGGSTEPQPAPESAKVTAPTTGDGDPLKGVAADVPTPAAAEPAKPRRIGMVRR